MRFRSAHMLAASLMLLAICSSPLLAQDTQPAQPANLQLPAGITGEWVLDGEAMLKNDARFAALDEAQKKAQVQMMTTMFGKLIITNEKTSMTMMGQEKVAAVEVKSVSADGKSAVFVTTEDGGKATELTATIIETGIMVTDGKMPMWFKRPVAEAPKPASELMIGQWALDIDGSIAATKKLHPEITAEQEAELRKELAGDGTGPVMTIGKDTISMSGIGEDGKKATHKVVSTDGNKVKLLITEEGAEGKENVFELTDKDTLVTGFSDNAMAFVFKRKKVNTVPSGKPGDIIGVWDIDVEATIKGDPDNAQMTEEELKMAMAMAGAMMAAMKIEFTEDTMFIVMGGQRIPGGTWKLVEQNGVKLTVEVTDLEGTTSTNTWMHTGDRLMATINGDPMHLVRSKK
ncbi:MAG: hypothetical protein AB7S36_01215 [Planctomycetota bacterium]